MASTSWKGVAFLVSTLARQFVNGRKEAACMHLCPDGMKQVPSWQELLQIIPRNILKIIFIIMTNIIPPEHFLCNLAATGLSLFAREHATEFAL